MFWILNYKEIISTNKLNVLLAVRLNWAVVVLKLDRLMFLVDLFV